MHISTLSGVGPKRAKTLEDAGITTVSDLLNYLPRDYDDRSEIRPIGDLVPGLVQTICCTLTQVPENVTLSRPSRGGKVMTLTKATLRDATGALELVWFNQPFLQKNLKPGRYYFTGMVRFAGRMQMQSPDYEKMGDNPLTAGRIVPLYTPPKGYSQKTFRALMHQAILLVGESITDELPPGLCKNYNLCNRLTAIQNIHFPESDELFLKARKRLVFEELFFMQLALLQLKGTRDNEAGIIFTDVNDTPLLDKLPFTPTNAQVKVLDEIKTDMQSGRVLNRLIQGDVGSGKTAVAMAAAYLAIKNGYQAAIMAPTEVLAQQHYDGFSRFFAPLGIKTVLLTGSLPVGTRRESLKNIQNGQAQMIVGTHALVQQGIKYFHLGLVITDEQHRFGVNQRLVLKEKGLSPHTLVMTATPIPRTLALILYGDLDISIIDELPPGRVPIKTYAVDSRYRPRIHNFIRKETEAGRQAYIICPAIEENDTPLSNVLHYTAELRAAFPSSHIACLHGRMKPTEKQEIMADFKANRIQVLISTTVIEVGVHVANATLMLIENADRFGLSQLHQLRGRVGRGTHESYCILVSDVKAPDTKARLQAMVDTSDGFVLAEHDLEQRGGGDFFGTRQHGLPAFGIANLYRDKAILLEAQEAARAFIQTDERFTPTERTAVYNRVAGVL